MDALSIFGLISAIQTSSTSHIYPLCEYSAGQSKTYDKAIDETLLTISFEYKPKIIIIFSNAKKQQSGSDNFDFINATMYRYSLIGVDSTHSAYSVIVYPLFKNTEENSAVLSSFKSGSSQYCKYLTLNSQNQLLLKGKFYYNGNNVSGTLNSFCIYGYVICE